MTGSTHVRVSLGCVALFLAGGLLLEAALGLRVSGLVDDPIGREFVRLGHAHGGVLSLVNLGIAWALERLATPQAWARSIRSASVTGALAVGLGFVGGGLWHGPTDPGPLVLLVPAGALALLGSLIATAVVRPVPRGQSRPGNDG